MTQYTVFTDGACSGNPGPGGWAAIISGPAGDGRREINGGEPATTNNRMELVAAIRGLASLPEGATVTVWTDSKYVRGGITSWLANWKRSGWRTSSRTPVKNVDLWKLLDRETAKRRVQWRWVAGHSGHVDNERADWLARQGMAPYTRW